MPMNWDNVVNVRNAQASNAKRFEATQVATNEQIQKAIEDAAKSDVILPKMTELEALIFRLRTELIDYIIEHGLVQGFEWCGEDRGIEGGKIVITDDMLRDALDRLGFFEEDDVKKYLEKYLPDNHYVSDADYVHTDNNYTDEEKVKLEGIEEGAEVNKVIDVVFNGVSVVDPDTRMATITITPEDIKKWYESNPDTNAFTDEDKQAIQDYADRLDNIEAHDKTQDNLLEEHARRLDKHQTEIEALQAADQVHDSRLDTIEKKDEEQDGRLDALENNDKLQDAELEELNQENLRQEQRWQAAYDQLDHRHQDLVEESQTYWQKFDEYEKKTDDVLDNHKDAIEALNGQALKDAEHFAELELKNNAQDTELNSLDERVTACEDADTKQDTDIAGIEDRLDKEFVKDVLVDGESIVDEDKIAKTDAAKIYYEVVKHANTVSADDQYWVKKAEAQDSSVMIQMPQATDTVEEGEFDISPQKWSDDTDGGVERLALTDWEATSARFGNVPEDGLRPLRFSEAHVKNPVFVRKTFDARTDVYSRGEVGEGYFLVTLNSGVQDDRDVYVYGQWSDAKKQFVGYGLDEDDGVIQLVDGDDSSVPAKITYIHPQNTAKMRVDHKFTISSVPVLVQDPKAIVELKESNALVSSYITDVSVKGTAVFDDLDPLGYGHFKGLYRFEYRAHGYDSGREWYSEAVRAIGNVSYFGNSSDENYSTAVVVFAGVGYVVPGYFDEGGFLGFQTDYDFEWTSPASVCCRWIENVEDHTRSNCTLNISSEPYNYTLDGVVTLDGNLYKDVKIDSLSDGGGTEYDDTDVKNRLTALEDADKTFATKEELSGYLTDEEASLTYATKDEIPSTDGFLTSTEADEKYATKSEIPSVDGLLSKTEAEETYAKKSEIPSTEGLLTEASAEETYAKKSEIPDTTAFLTKEAAAIEYATKSEIPSTDGFATDQDITDLSDRIDALEGGGGSGSSFIEDATHEDYDYVYIKFDSNDRTLLEFPGQKIYFSKLYDGTNVGETRNYVIENAVQKIFFYDVCANCSGIYKREYRYSEFGDPTPQDYFTLVTPVKVTQTGVSNWGQGVATKYGTMGWYCRLQISSFGANPDMTPGAGFTAFIQGFNMSAELINPGTDNRSDIHMLVFNGDVALTSSERSDLKIYVQYLKVGRHAELKQNLVAGKQQA